MKANKFVIILFLFFLTSFFVTGLAISGNKMKIVIDHMPGYETEDVFYITNKESYVSTYDIFTANEEGASLGEYFTIIPNRIESVKPGETRSFTVRLDLPDYIDNPGKNLMLVKARIDASADNAMLRAFPSVAILYVINVLRPEKYVQTGIIFPNMNEDEKTDVGFSIYNLGQPSISSTKGNITVISKETQQVVATLFVPEQRNIVSWEQRSLITEFDSYGLQAGKYQAFGTIYWDENVSNMDINFSIGKMTVNILNFTKLFEYNSISKFDIEIESGWNTEIKNIYAEVFIYDTAGNQVQKFKSVNTNLEPWETKTLDAYFDTTGLEIGEYKARVVLEYGEVTIAEDIVKIDENIGAELFDEIPGQFKLSNLTAKLTTMNLLYFLIGIFVLLNIFLLTGVVRKKSEPKEIKVDSAVVDKIAEMRKQFKDSYIKEMMIKKGWSEDKVDLIIKEAKKK